MSDPAAPSRPSAFWQRPLVLVGVCTALTLAMVTGESVVALAITLMEGVPALAAIGLASLAGMWIVRLGHLAPPGAGRVIVGAALGTGVLSLLTFGLGTAGILNRPVAILLMTAMSLLGIAALAVELRGQKPAACASIEPAHWLWLVTVPFLAITAAAACLPPGILWKDEGFAYDVLEYHLAVPKIFLTDGRIHFLANNVYSNFPLNSEMLFLLMMHLRGDAIEAAFMATFVNVALAALFVAAAWWAGSAFGRPAGLVSGVAAAGVPWLTYLSGITYVETGMLATGMTALALLLHCVRAGEASPRPFIAAGLIAGFCCGFKYTAVPMITLPLAVLTVCGTGSAADRLKRAGFFAAAAWLAFAPWMIRNVVNTGNPFFPLAYSVFGARPELWNAETQAVWQHAHGSSEAEQNVAPVWQRALERSLAEPLMGWSLFVLASLGAIRRRDRWTGVLLVILLVQLVVWLVFTHLFARFIVVALLPLAILAGRSIEGLAWKVGPAEAAGPPRAEPVREGPPGGRVPAALLLIVVVLGSITNLYRIGRLYYDHTRIDGRRLDAYGHTNWFVSTGQWPTAQHWGAINALPAGSRVMLVGEARTFYVLTPCDYSVVFNRHPLAEAVERIIDPAGVIGWLRENGFTHVLADWGEMGRLATTYGFYTALSPELFVQLEAVGLRRAGLFALRDGAAPYATLYEVPRP